MKHLWIAALATAACADVKGPPAEQDENEVITTVELELTPAGGPGQIVRWADPENDGDPIIDGITLGDGAEFTLAVRFFNELEDPAQELTAEIADEAEEHQIFWTGSSVDGPATGSNPSAVVEQAYNDMDANGLPIGLGSIVTTIATGSGDLTVTLRHLPDQSGSPQKTEGIAAEVADGGFAAIGGDSDISATFPITVE